jgi:hypothetical protein
MPYFINVEWIKAYKLPETSKNVYILVDHPHFQRSPEDTTSVYIGIQGEPDSILHLRQAFIDNHRAFDTILTHDDEILRACPNARLYLWGTTWMPPEIYHAIDVNIKKYSISVITGTKELTPAHTFRKSLYMNQILMGTLPITWFRSSKGPLMPKIGNNPIIGESKAPLFLEYQYSVVIENCRQNNYFSEKLVDCLITKTIPIYYGCPNISNWFDTRGWIILESTSIQEFRMKCSRLPNYAAHVNVINENFERAKHYSSLEANLQRAINFGD